MIVFTEYPQERWLLDTTTVPMGVNINQMLGGKKYYTQQKYWTYHGGGSYVHQYIINSDARADVINNIQKYFKEQEPVTVLFKKGGNQ